MIELEVTEHDMTYSPRNPWGCPIAMALKRKFPYREINVFITRCLVDEQYFLLDTLGRSISCGAIREGSHKITLTPIGVADGIS